MFGIRCCFTAIGLLLVCSAFGESLAQEKKASPFIEKTDDGPYSLGGYGPVPGSGKGDWMVYLYKKEPGEGHKKIDFKFDGKHPIVTGLRDLRLLQSYWALSAISPDGTPYLNVAERQLLKQGIELAHANLFRLVRNIHDGELDQKEEESLVRDITAAVDDALDTIPKDVRKQIEDGFVVATLSYGLLSGFEDTLISYTFNVDAKTLSEISQLKSESEEKAGDDAVKLVAEYEQRVLEVLTPEQRKKWRALAGDPRESDLDYIRKKTAMTLSP
jgi:hypothetical protein